MAGINKKADSQVPKELIEFILAIAGIAILLLLFFKIFAPSYNPDEEAAKSIAEDIENKINNLQEGQEEIIMLWQANKVWIVNFGDKFLYEHDNAKQIIRFKTSYGGKNKICACISDAKPVSPSLKTGGWDDLDKERENIEVRCKYCFNAKYSLGKQFAAGSGEWIFLKREKEAIKSEIKFSESQESIDTSKRNVVMDDCDGDARNYWFSRSGEDLKYSQEFNIAVKKCLDVENGNAVLNECSDSESQLWRIDQSGCKFNTLFETCYILINKKTGGCLDIENNNEENGANVIVFSCKGEKNQGWRTILSSSYSETIAGKVNYANEIKSFLNRKCLSVEK